MKVLQMRVQSGWRTGPSLRHQWGSPWIADAKELALNTKDHSNPVHWHSAAQIPTHANQFATFVSNKHSCELSSEVLCLFHFPRYSDQDLIKCVFLSCQQEQGKRLRTALPTYRLMETGIQLFSGRLQLMQEACSSRAGNISFGISGSTWHNLHFLLSCCGSQDTQSY